MGLLFLAACTRQKQPPSAPEQTPWESHIALSPAGTNQTVLQKTFSLTTSASFPFEIPPHAVRPHLHGIFESFARDARGQSDEAANLDFLVLTQDQYDDFSHGRPGEALFSAEASHNQAINFDLPASLDHSVKYYLVFRSSTDSGPKKVVEANFRVDF
jgi:hypothetical protein